MDFGLIQQLERIEARLAQLEVENRELKARVANLETVPPEKRKK